LKNLINYEMIVLPIIPTSAIQRLKGSALGDGIACMIRKIPTHFSNKREKVSVNDCQSLSPSS
jgi:hypothetical protein